MAVYATIMYFAFVHGALLVLYSVAAFGADLLVRYILHTIRVVGIAEHKPGDVVQLSFEKKFTYRAGQYVFIMIPALGVHEWHPFSVSSAPHEETVTLHVGVLGDWTRRLADLVQSQESAPQELTAFVEGPYGLPAVNFEDDTYQIVVLISGSIGVTPHQSLANHLLDAHAHGRPLKKLIYVWALRESKLGLITTMSQSGQFPPNRQLTIITERAACADVELFEKDLQGEEVNPLALSGVLHTVVYCTRRGFRETAADLGVPGPDQEGPTGAAADGAEADEAEGKADEGRAGSGYGERDGGDSAQERRSRESWRSGSVPDLEAGLEDGGYEYDAERSDPREDEARDHEVDRASPVKSAYSEKRKTGGVAEGALTMERDLEVPDHAPGPVAGSAAGGVPEGLQLHHGRPDFSQLFARVKELAVSLGERRVAVSVCGPATMVESATSACRAATSKEVQLDLHIEVFRV